jgi:hypothetical protein
LTLGAISDFIPRTGEAQNSYDIQISTRLVVDNNSIQNQNQKVLFKVGTLATCTLAVGVQKSKHRNVCINIIWICINFVLHDVFYCAVFNLCNLLCMSVWKALKSLCCTVIKCTDFK